MNYQRYREWQEEVLKKRSPRRLDCMNPVKALEFVSRPMEQQKHPVAPADLLKWWKRTFALNIEHDQITMGPGVREILQIVLECLYNEGRTLWLPEDVYPVYFELAGRLCIRPYETLVDFNLDFLENSSDTDVLLITDPLTPLGRYLQIHELEQCNEWLRKSPNRLLIIDAVYCFGPDRLSRLNDILETDQAVVLYSLSKAWLAPHLLGVAACPRRLTKKIDGQGNGYPVDSFDKQQAYSIVTADPGRPLLLQKLFFQQWLTLEPEIRKASDDWRPPQTGYFSMIPINYNFLLQEHNMLAVPASVFGSKRENLSVISCLFDIRPSQETLDRSN